MLRRILIKNGWIEGLPASDPRITAFKGIPLQCPQLSPYAFGHLFRLLLGRNHEDI